MAVELHFEHGTLVIPHLPDPDETLQRLLTRDERTGSYRAPAHHYRDIALHLHRVRAEDFVDRARGFERLELPLAEPITPFPHQAEALDAWVQAGKRGICELPTGAGKTLLAVLAIAKTGRPTLVVVPTIDLLHQWQAVLEKHLGRPIGMLGGGASDRREVTVTTYDSAAFQTEFHGHRFGLLVCDECHHLPAQGYQFIAAGSIAPFRLGLTATLERTDGGERVAVQLLGPRVYQARIGDLEGQYLAPYEIRTVPVAFTEEEQATYDEARALYKGFLRGSGIDFRRNSAWAEFITLCHRSEAGKRAFAAYRTQRRLAFSSSGKVEALWKILVEHRGERVLVFTDDNETVYRLSEQMLLPVITHHTKGPERRALLAAFASGELPVLLTSRVLNEGVDVPDARIGVILSGSGSVREHVQRLGRILRKRPDKQAILYEVVTEASAESNVSERRRQHQAYQRAEAEPGEEPC